MNRFLSVKSVRFLMIIMNKTRIEILKQYAEYDRSKKYGYENKFVLGGDIPQILEKYSYSEYIENFDRTKDEIVFRLLDFVCDNFGHNGSGGMGSGRKNNRPH